MIFDALAQPFSFAPRRSQMFRVRDLLDRIPLDVSDADFAALETIDLAYRTLCGVLFNYVPTSGHPGGSISSGRIVESLIYLFLDYDFSRPTAPHADQLVYAAGHKALGLYASWALRNELARIAAPDLLPEEKFQLRLEDLLGFRRNPTQDTPLFHQYRAKALDGHPTPATPFASLATGASGVGVPAAMGLALGALDIYPAQPPRIHALEGEGGLTPGRVHEALAGASAANLANFALHVDWNQASIDSNCVCAEDGRRGDYVQWSPAELAHLHEWNVVQVDDGADFRQVVAAQRLAAELANGLPTAIVYRTTKGWHYGLEGRASHGAGHPFCSDAFYQFVAAPFEARFREFGVRFPRCTDAKSPAAVEETYFQTLLCIRGALEKEAAAARFAADRLRAAQRRLAALARRPRADAPHLEVVYDDPELRLETPPAALQLTPGKAATLRGAVGDALAALNEKTGGAFIVSSADLFESTSVAKTGAAFGKGFQTAANRASRLLPVGGICEDAMGALMAGLSAYGRHIGVTSSYGAFLAALEHVPARLHCIGQQARRQLTGEPFRTFIMVNAHAGVKTGEDGPTHADPQCLQLLQENFPRGALITLTPWDAQEAWPLLLAGLRARPAVLCPFVTRPNEIVPDRAALGLPPPEASVKGVCRLIAGDPERRPYHGTLVLQGSEIGVAFVADVLPVLRREKLNMNVYYIASAELFDLLPEAEQLAIYPEARAREAMGITGFTPATMHRWVTSYAGRRRLLHPFLAGRYLGSGAAAKVMEEGGLSGPALAAAVLDYARFMECAGKEKGKNGDAAAALKSASPSAPRVANPTEVAVQIAERISRLGTETAFEVLARARALEAKGREIVHLEIGEPDFATPANIVAAAKDGLDKGFTHYGPSAGLPELRETIARDAGARRGLTFAPEQVVVTPGAKPIIFFALLAIANEGDEVIYPNPGFPIYESVIRFIGAKPVALPLLEERAFSFDVEHLQRLVTDKTRMIILNSPQNPTGGVLTRADLAAVAKIARERGIWIFADEIYINILYEGEFETIAREPGVADRLIILDGFSKTYAMTGWRAGYGIMPKELATHVTRLMTNSNSCTNSFVQYACLEALRGPQDEAARMVEEFRKRRDFIVDGLNDLPGFSCVRPKGAFYVFPNVKKLGQTSSFLENFLMNEAGVAALSGTAFGAYGEGYLRFSYANSVANIDKALKNIRGALSKLG
jgi:transketolase